MSVNQKARKLLIRQAQKIVIGHKRNLKLVKMNCPKILAVIVILKTLKILVNLLPIRFLLVENLLPWIVKLSAN